MQVQETLGESGERGSRRRRKERSYCWESPKLSDRHTHNQEPMRVTETSSSNSVTLGLLLGGLNLPIYANSVRALGFDPERWNHFSGWLQDPLDSRPTLRKLDS